MSATAVEQVVPGVWSIALPMPGMELVNVFALEGDRGVVLVDAGWRGAEGAEPLATALASFGASLADVQAVLVTHGHPDHAGLLDDVREASGAWGALHPADAGAAIVGGLCDRARTEAWAASLGLGSEERRALVETIEELLATRRPVEPDRLLGDGDALTVDGHELRVIHTPGHSPGHVCFVYERLGVVFTGDLVLSLTTPNVSVRPGVDESPLADYVASLTKMRTLRGLTSLPGHEGRVDPAVRAVELLAHHESQLAVARKLVSSGRRTVRAIAEEMEWSRPWADLDVVDAFLAYGETLAHLVVLEERGQVVRSGAGVLEWSVAGSGGSGRPGSGR